MLNVEEHILKVTNASAILNQESVQELWSGYGEIIRYSLENGEHTSVIVKYIRLPEEGNHPRGWNTTLSHERKLHSYKVEMRWYEVYAPRLNDKCKVPLCLDIHEEHDELLIILEDLDASGFNKRIHHDDSSIKIAKQCLKWLASFHAEFIDTDSHGLWTSGTYWHLATRPDELKRMQNMDLKSYASDIDELLSSAKFQTLVHGDAKLANFCFGEGENIAAVDFQYVGKGCGMKDVAYLISSCFYENECIDYEEELLDYYFTQLELVIDKNIDFQILKEEWSQLYKYAWADFYRFLDGWSPGHWKMHSYSRSIVNEVIDELKGT